MKNSGITLGLASGPENDNFSFRLTDEEKEKTGIGGHGVVARMCNWKTNKWVIPTWEKGKDVFTPIEDKEVTKYLEAEFKKFYRKFKKDPLDMKKKANKTEKFASGLKVGDEVVRQYYDDHGGRPRGSVYPVSVVEVTDKFVVMDNGERYYRTSPHAAHLEDEYKKKGYGWFYARVIPESELSEYGWQEYLPAKFYKSAKHAVATEEVKKLWEKNWRSKKRKFWMYFGTATGEYASVYGFDIKILEWKGSKIKYKYTDSKYERDIDLKKYNFVHWYLEDPKKHDWCQELGVDPSVLKGLKYR